MSGVIARAEKDIDKAVLELLLHSQQWPWSAEEVGREIGDRLDAKDAVSRLARAGLAHRHDEFVFPTRAEPTTCTSTGEGVRRFGRPAPREATATSDGLAPSRTQTDLPESSLGLI